LRQSRLVHGGLVVGAGILFGNITGFFRVAVAAYLVGTHARADSLAVATGPLDTMNSVIVNTMLFAFTPMLMAQEGADRAALFARASRVFAIILACASVAAIVLAPQLIGLLGPGLTGAPRDEAVILLRLIAPATLFAGCAAACSALLYTERRFLVPGLYQACLNGATIVAALSLWKAAGIYGFAIGYTAGAALQLVITWTATRDLRRTAKSDLRFPLSEILAKPGMFLFYAGLIAANIIVTRAFATQAGSGMAAAFEYCMRCASVVIAYLVYPVATTLVPELARLRATNQARQAFRLIDKSAGVMALGSAAACAIGIWLRTPVIRLLFQRGNFTPESTMLVSAVFLGFAPSLVGWALMDLIARCFFAVDSYRVPLLAACVPVSVNLAVMTFLRAQGRLSDPAMLGTGASAGLAAGFTVLFAMIHIQRRNVSLTPALVDLTLR
jgi:putative peptidoglycan lipid II flippase